METLNRCSQYRFKSGKIADNRVVVPPMASGTADPAGFVTRATLEHYAGLAGSGAGVVMVEYTYVHASGKSEENQLGAHSDAHIAGLRRLSRTIQATGALSFLQLTHAGGKTSRDLTGGVLQGPSAVAVPVKDREMEAPSPMTMDDAAQWVESFRSAARRAAIAGFDGIELHAAHGYGLNQWLSPITNRREDTYGGSLAGRFGLLSQIVEAVRLEHAGLLISVRMPGQDFLAEGLSVEDGVLLARHLEERGVDLIHVSSGIGGWRRPQDREGQGYLVNEASVIQKGVGVPVIGVGGIETGEYIDALVEQGRVTFAAVGRAILGDPRKWKAKNLCPS